MRRRDSGKGEGGGVVEEHIKKKEQNEEKYMKRKVDAEKES